MAVILSSDGAKIAIVFHASADNGPDETYTDLEPYAVIGGPYEIAYSPPEYDGKKFAGWFYDDGRSRYISDCSNVRITLSNDGKFHLYGMYISEPVYEFFSGKKVSVMGDSISTMHGITPYDGYDGDVEFRYYYVKNDPKYDGISYETTWWGRLIEDTGATLLVDDASSGSLVSDRYGYDDYNVSGHEGMITYDAMMSWERVDSLSKNGTDPDIILVYAGFNDSYLADEIGTYEEAEYYLRNYDGES